MPRTRYTIRSGPADTDASTRSVSAGEAFQLGCLLKMAALKAMELEPDA